MQNIKKTSIIEQLKTNQISFETWYKYIYNNMWPNLSLNECISLLNALLSCKVIFNCDIEQQQYIKICKKLNINLDRFMYIKQVIKIKESKTKILK